MSSTFQMMQAIQNGDRQKVLDLLKDGYELESLEYYSNGGFTALQVAVSREKVDICRDLIDAGAKVSVSANDGFEPLMSASMRGNNEICAMLLAAGADLEAVDKEGHTPLHTAVNNNNPDTVAFLLEKGANPNCLNERGRGPLHDVSCSMHSALFKREIAEMLVTHGASSSFVPANHGKKYLTPFQKAVADGDLQGVKYFVERFGEDLDQKTASGKSLLQISRDRPKMHSYILSLRSENAVIGALGSETESPVAKARSAGLSPL